MPGLPVMYYMKVIHLNKVYKYRDAGSLITGWGPACLNLNGSSMTCVKIYCLYIVPTLLLLLISCVCFILFVHKSTLPNVWYPHSRFLNCHIFGVKGTR
ncbi:hypothetical protein XENTR_v10005002 [Xenopus tropicalis]|nr:hypothetical protein XENTR_v10005002 [Xenopus tropicalis]